MDHGIVMSTLSCINKVHLIHVKSWKFKAIRSQEMKTKAAAKARIIGTTINSAVVAW